MNNRKYTKGRKSWRIVSDSISHPKHCNSRHARRQERNIDPKEVAQLRADYWKYRDMARHPVRYIDQRLKVLSKVLQAIRPVQEDSRTRLIQIKERMLKLGVTP